MVEELVVSTGSIFLGVAYLLGSRTSGRSELALERNMTRCSVFSFLGELFKITSGKR